jgi:HAMP domain-containing protein
MRNVRVRKEDLIGIVERNRATHGAVFEKAYERFRCSIERELEERLSRIRKGKSVDLAIRLPEPRDMTATYDRVLEMLAMETRDEVELTEQEFQQFVQDDWTWKREFATTASLYGVV